MTTEEIMLHVQALDPSACIRYSTWTHKWYVQSNLSVGNGTILTGLAEHEGTAEAAARAFFARCTDLTIDEYVASAYHGHRREWRWNGAAFAECTRDEVFEQEAKRSAVSA